MGLKLYFTIFIFVIITSNSIANKLVVTMKNIRVVKYNFNAIFCFFNLI